LPGDRTKNGRTHVVSLSAAAVAIFDALAGGESWPKKGLVFTTTGSTSVSGYSRAKRRLDSAMADLATQSAEGGPSVISPWRVHDIRRTMATGFQRLDVRFEVTEAVLNHVSGARGGVAGVYQRHEWADEKRHALDRWAAHLNACLDGASERSNLIPFRGPAAV
jgi:hypothetical protein